MLISVFHWMISLELDLRLASMSLQQPQRTPPQLAI